MQRLKGIGVSPGAVWGRAVILIQRAQLLRYRVAPMHVDRELERLAQSRLRTRQQIRDIRDRIERRRGPDLAGLFDAQLLMVDDPLIIPRAEALVRDQLLNAEWAVQRVCDELSTVFDELADPYLRERQGDVADIVGRLRSNLREGAAAPPDLLRPVQDASVLIADYMPPSLVVQIDWTKVRGFATDAGSRTYHTAILARSLRVPAVVGLRRASRSIQPGQMVIIDGSGEEIIVEPDADLLARISRRADDRRQATVGGVEHRSARTADGVTVRLDANVEFPGDLGSARDAGAERVGLYRSEFLFGGGGHVPTEDEQYEVYARMLAGMAPGSVTVRTFDVDEDQLTIRRPGEWLESGPSERGRGSGGLRGLRLSLARRDLFRTQLRALLRAAPQGALRIMFPFVSGLEQLRAARRETLEVAAELEAEGHAVTRVPIGVMIEVPAAAYTADLLAREADFFTVGTNDLIQYCLAVDRADERVSALYEPLHPAILRLIVMVRRAATRHGIPVSICGEMASDPAILPLLVGLGFREFSMTPGAIPAARQVLAERRSDDLRSLARRVLRLHTAAEIESALAAESCQDRIESSKGETE